MEEEFSIRVNVAERYYPLRIKRKEEEIIRRASKLINDRIAQYKRVYPDKDLQDFLSMAALQFVISLLKEEQKHDMEPLMEELKDLSSELEAFFSELE